MLAVPAFFTMLIKAFDLSLETHLPQVIGDRKDNPSRHRSPSELLTADQYRQVARRNAKARAMARRNAIVQQVQQQ